MPFPDDADDDRGFVPPLPPEDRLWRHPSERAMAPAATAVAPRRRRRRRPVSIFGFLGLLLVVVAAMTVVTLVRLDETGDRFASDAALDGGVVPVGVLENLSPAVVRVTAERPDGTRSTTGLVLRSDGHIVTTADPIIGATSVTVRVADGTTFNARIVGTDRADDLAVLDIATTEAATARFADPATITGDRKVFVVGRTSDGSRWVTSGSIDGLRQRLTANDGTVLLGLFRALLTSSPSSGSAVVCTEDGSVLGIVTARTPILGTSPTPSTSSTIGTAGRTIAFATPAPWIARVADEIIATGTFHRPWIGIVGDDAPEGAVVRAVIDSGPAARAGLVTGDVVTSIDGDRVTDADDLAMDVRSRRPGDRVSIAFVHEGVQSQVSVVLSERT